MFFFIFLIPLVSGQLCLLCDGNIKRPYLPVDYHGTSIVCSELGVRMAVDEGPGKGCDKLKRAYVKCCVSGGKGERKEVNRCDIYKKKNARIYKRTAVNPVCNLCRTNEYPGNDRMVINILYMAPGTCGSYYELGQRGAIQSHVCSALQYFAHEPCGCGKYNVYRNCSEVLIK